MSFCTDCGKENNTDDKFCYSCGKSLEQHPTSTNPSSERATFSGAGAYSSITQVDPYGRKSGPYSLENLTKAIYVFLALQLITSLGAMITAFSFGSKISNYGYDSWRQAMRAEETVLNWELASFIFLLITGILFITFIWRSTKNLITAGLATKRGAGWSIGGWFIPIGFLWIPYQTVKELIELQPNIDDPWGPEEMAGREIARNTKWWLIIWISGFITELLGRISVSIWETANNIDDLSAHYTFQGIVGLIWILLIGGYFFITQTIYERQKGFKSRISS